MQITSITAKAVRIPLVKPLVIAIGVISHCETVFVKVETDEGITGYGEGAGISFVTGETTDTVIGAVRMLTPVLTGLDPFSIEHIHRKMDETIVRNSSAKAAIDLALYDIMGKAAKKPLYKLLGGVANSVETDMTIGIDTPDAMAEKALKLAGKGYRYIKVKAGSDMKSDAEAMRLIRDAVGHDVHIKVDANQGWNVPQSLQMLKVYAGFGVDAVEQPLPYWDIDGLSYVRAHSPIAIMADESCFSPQDAMRLVRREAVDYINIKLMKCGGLYRAMQISAIAESAGVQCMLGCMLESRLSIAAGAALVASHPNIAFADLDSFDEFDDSSLIRSAFRFEPPVIHLSDGYGLGVVVEDF